MRGRRRPRGRSCSLCARDRCGSDRYTSVALFFAHGSGITAARGGGRGSERVKGFVGHSGGRRSASARGQIRATATARLRHHPAARIAFAISLGRSTWSRLTFCCHFAIGGQRYVRLSRVARARTRRAAPRHCGPCASWPTLRLVYRRRVDRRLGSQRFEALTARNCAAMLRTAACAATAEREIMGDPASLHCTDRGEMLRPSVAISVEKQRSGRIVAARRPEADRAAPGVAAASLLPSSIPKAGNVHPACVPH